MHVPCWPAALLAAAAATVAPTLAAQVPSRDAPTPSYVAVSLIGQHMGRFPATNCLNDPAKGVYVTEFVETTPASAPAGFGSFDMKLPGACVTPFFQALFARERLTAVVTFVSSDGTPSMTLSLSNAQLARVRLVTINAGSSAIPILQVSVAAPQVIATAGGAPAAVSPTSASGTITTSGTTTSRMSPQRMTSRPPLRRTRAPEIRLPLSRTIPVASATQSAGAGWMQHGGQLGYVGADLVAATSPSFDFNVHASDLYVDAGYALDAATQMPTGAMQVALGPLHRAADALSASLKTAATAHAPLTQAVFTAHTVDGAPVITLTLHGATLASDQLGSLNAGSSSVQVETIQLTIGGLTITDIGSGKTAQSQP